MCGIAGYFARNAIDTDQGREILRAMTKALHHRGPDGEGVHVTPHCGLASTRLAIIDLEHGAMPMFNEDGSVAVTYNGEIYNHAALRAELEGRGHTFKTRADTEVLVHAYEDAPESFARRLTGMFAFAIFDAKRKRLALVRDRFGIKPLLTAETKDGLVLFASEAKAILATGLIERGIDRRALLDLFSAGYPMPPRTVFEGIRALPPASMRVLSADGADRTTIYWAVPYPTPGAVPPKRHIDDAARELDALLRTVVSDHMIADVPVGSYLSGGIDSIAVATLAARTTPHPLSTFSMGFGAPDLVYDESDLARRVGETLKSDHHRLEIGGISYEDYVGTLTAMEAPQVHTVAFCLYQLSRSVKAADLKVVLTGEGSDEIFAGYGAFRLRRARRIFSGWFRPFRDLFLRTMALLGGKPGALFQSMHRWAKLEKHVAHRFGILPPWIEQWWLLLEESLAILTPEAREHLGASTSADASLLPEPPRPPEAARAKLHEELRFEQATRLDGWVLALGDRLTMAHSVEARVPYLDHRVAELTASLPTRHLLRGLEEKSILRRAMAGTILETARRRKKRAFMAPITRWLFERPRPAFVDDTLSASALEKHRLFDPRAVEKRLSYLESGRKDLAALRASWALNLALGIELIFSTFGAPFR
jgi:asparagine synthase (glutamine-hydrolysing)